jgi:hypothetical protein
MVFGYDTEAQPPLFGVSLQWLTQGNPGLQSAWENCIFERATNLHSSGGYSVLAQGLSHEEIYVKEASLPELWINSWQAEGYSASETNDIESTLRC